ncbi:dTDP-4-dehydrorhamnose 3,5-epimerase [Altererythrobacter epoxidivorans]|uniref:dTDP-4-dehydrorhamnose 3,5-epimerase n=2 Tax=Altererythrobacter epoxidivorans TaxID=361183 RepID=A0A0M4MXY0_9SPHN|nr:dTDP-4-dehydrorhamnose 3,5-epimerase [Altererythrobacter epoxidivorans]
MQVRQTPIDGLLMIEPARFGDDRGWFEETWNAQRYAAAGIGCDWVQDNHSMSSAVGTLRGLHYQKPPNAQAKLVRCTRGKIWDVAVDYRPQSPTYLKYFGIELDPQSGTQLFIPSGFLHGFVTLEPNSELQYKCSAPYAPESDGAIRWNDPDIGIDWPLEGDPVLSAKDEAAPLTSDVASPF